MAFGIGGKIKKGLGSIANKVADKLIPKELAPFLPMLAPLLMGPAAGIFGNTVGRYLVPQILTALSTGKTTGDISGTSQALTGLGSFLSDPGRFELGRTEAVSEQGKTFIEGVRTDDIRPPDVIGSEPVSGRSFTKGQLRRGFDTRGITETPTVQPSKTFTGTARQRGPSYSTTGVTTDPVSTSTSTSFRMPNPDFVAAKPSAPIFTLPEDPTLMQRLKFGVNEARDFIQGTNVADRPFSKEKIEIADDISAGDLEKLNENMFDPYAGSDIARGPYKAGDPVMVRDAGFMQNVPRQAIQQGLQTIGPGLAVADKMKTDAAAEAAAFQDSIDDYYGSRQALFDYFGNARPNYGLLYGGGFADGGIASLPAGMPQGMQVDGRNGTFIPMGVKEKADDVPAMLSKNEFVMTADAVRAAGGGSVEKGAQRMYDLMNSLEAKV